MSLNRSQKIYLIIILALLGLLVTSQAVGAPTKPEMVTMTKEQWDSLNSKLEYWVYAFVAFLAKEVWELVKGKGRKLSDIEKNVEKILTRMENVPTKEYVKTEIKEAIEHYHEVSG